jgi:hypothetical protein
MQERGLQVLKEGSDGEFFAPPSPYARSFLPFACNAIFGTLCDLNNDDYPVELSSAECKHLCDLMNRFRSQWAPADLPAIFSTLLPSLSSH